MSRVDIELPADLESQIMAALQPMIDRALDVVHEVPAVVKDTAALSNLDVDGQQMSAKKPRPRKSPANNPNLPCVDTGNMFDNTRWTTAKTGDTEAECVYTPPTYFEHLIGKPADQGGRKWITPDKINDDARQTIEEKMVIAIRGGADQGGFGAAPEGFELA